MDGWPPGHTIGVYLSTGVEQRLVGTARSGDDVASLLRELATRWEVYGCLPVPNVDELGAWDFFG